jgi:hypothetical protein
MFSSTFSATTFTKTTQGGKTFVPPSTTTPSITTDLPTVTTSQSVSLPTTAGFAQTKITTENYTAVNSTDKTNPFPKSVHSKIDQFLDHLAYSTIKLIFGNDNDTKDASNNETSRVAKGATLFAGGTVSWPEEILTWFRVKFSGVYFV